MKHNCPDFVILTTGQSNSIGNGGHVDFHDERDHRHENILTWNVATFEWEIACLSKEMGSKPAFNQSLSFHFAKHVTKLFPNKKLGLIILGVGNTSICAWTRSCDSQQFEKSINGKLDHGTIYNTTVKHVSAALHKANKTQLDLILWHQGEADYDESHTYYEQRLHNIIKSYRNESFGYTNLPFICGLVQYISPEWIYNKQNHVLKNVKNLSKWSSCADTSQLPCVLFDPVHFSSEGHRLMGEKYYEEFIIMCKNVAKRRD
jgi:hypothetical protein